MEYNIKDQIETWTRKQAYYEGKRAKLVKLISEYETKRSEVDQSKVGDPEVGRFYQRLNSLYTQLHTLPAKIGRCKANIQTLTCELYN